MDNKNIKYREKEKLNFRTKEEISTDSSSVGNSCPSCGHLNDSDSKFCSECASSLSKSVVCPNCNVVARPHADICESCQTWLLKGQCMFCYAPVKENDKFCGECGSSASGIECPQCKEVSIFDFCKTCYIPLSNQAQVAMQDAKNNEVFQELNALIEEIMSVPDVVVVEQSTENKQIADLKVYEDYLKLKAYRESIKTPTNEPSEKPKGEPLFSKVQKEQINQLYTEIKLEEERKEKIRLQEERKLREAEAKRLALLEEFNNVMSKFQNKKFFSEQEARRFYMSMFAHFPKEFLDVEKFIAGKSLGWRCNAYGVLHSGPTGCGGPGAGGVWVFK